METWRYLPFADASAFENMATDEALLRHAGAAPPVPTLRFFGWNPPAVSIGYFQDAASEVNLPYCREHGICVVRRPTGGKAVFHDREVTYAIVAGENHPLFPRGILGTYRAIGSAILRAFSKLGLKAEMTADGRSHAPGGLEAFCFSVPSQYELLLQGRKVCGSAQTRSRGAFLQHGSILLDFDPVTTAAVLPGPAEETEQKVRKMEMAVTSLRDHLKGGITPLELTGVLLESFEEVFHVRIAPGELSEEERSIKERLFREKYTLDMWNIGGKNPGESVLPGEKTQKQ
ncbi:MAG TPA: biotin/lipoate A/B protein ligase family protein [Syntrophales bacterium]|nr:biotin/lipoate A/B protein ligase family protein [Syntrophales bacterium]HOX94564.1 biotin/lipoate A/B protein ligase family protein [Syntrophales bacterium]HPI57673.1 biotin/lipoate A/B protein ligase family protein [Syntrophales bacterium]HPN23906.1 biotin/lipoate A/B protein ligase family protein [Syntrophales bacterium]HQM28184.1 biotin/lipoate A/B protein ligase family protein [Syntrophales bacterium]